jgi:hexokinase
MNVSSLVVCLLLLLSSLSIAQDITKAQKEIVKEEWLTIENVHKMIQAGKLDCFIDEDNTNIRYVIKSQVLAMRRKVRGE